MPEETKQTQSRTPTMPAANISPKSIEDVEDFLTTSIKDEDDFHDLIEAEKEKHTSHTEYGNFSGLVNELHTLLKQQDSDKALSLITRGALGL